MTQTFKGKVHNSMILMIGVNEIMIYDQCNVYYNIIMLIHLNSYPKV